MLRSEIEAAAIAHMESIGYGAYEAQHGDPDFEAGARWALAQVREWAEHQADPLELHRGAVRLVCEFCEVQDE